MPRHLVASGLAALLLLTASAPAAAAQRTRKFCGLFGKTVNCGKDRQVACDSGSACDSGYAPYSGSPLPKTVNCPSPIPDETVDSVCYKCGGNHELGCSTGSVCKSGLVHAATSGLDGPITQCTSLLPPDPGKFDLPDGSSVTVTSSQVVNLAGICSMGSPTSLSGASRETWPVSEAPSDERGTVFVIHGRGASCGGGRSDLLNDGGADLYDRHYLTYCVQYAQTDLDPGRREIAILPVAQDEAGTGGPSCALTDSCTFDQAHPVHVERATAYDMNAMGAALARAIETVPTVGEITLIPHSQGGFITRELIHRHYDELRWQGKKISRVISLAHPWYAKVVDPPKVTPWLCADHNNFDCVFFRWLWGWDRWLASSPGHIDDVDFPQIQWTAVAGDGFEIDGVTPAYPSAEPQSDSCLHIFGGVWRLDEAGDTSVPIQSSLGVDEHGFYNASPLSFDSAHSERCVHNAPCLLRSALARDPGILPGVPAPGLGYGSLDFDGVDDAISVSDPAAVAALTQTGDFTMEAWFRVEGDGQAGSEQMILNKEGEYELGLERNTGRIAWAIDTATPGWVWKVTSYAPPRYQWTHVAVVHRKDQDIRTYVNGELVMTVPAAGAVGDANAIDDLRIGDRGAGGAPFDGRIDDVRIWSKALTPEEIRDGLENGPIPNAPGLVGWWRFDESSGLVAADTSPNGFDVALDGLGATRAPTHRPDDRARPGGALVFDGVDDHVDVSEPQALAELTMTDALTLEAWVYPRGPGSHATAGGVIVHKEGEYGLVRLTNGYLAFSLANTTPGWVTYGTNVYLPERQWSHVALRYATSLGQVEIYLNGALAQTIPASGPIGDVHTSWNELRIGGRQHPTNLQFFDGVIDEVRVWRVARSPSAIARTHAQALRGNETGLAGYWRFDQQPTGVALDSSVEAHHATLGGGNVGASPVADLAPQLPGYPTTLLDPPPSPPPGPSCGLGVELVPLLGLLGLARRARSRRDA